MAQEREHIPFNGMVTDVLGTPLKGVKVYTYDSKWFAKTDKKGRFGLTDVRSTDTIHVEYKKMQYDIPVDTLKSMRIVLADMMKCSVQQDDELISLGMMYVKRREYNAPHSGISGETLVRTGYTSISKAIIGLVPGLTMMNGKLLIRGITSLNVSNEPLYIADGVQIPDLDFIPVYDVERIDVLKDGSMYGARGANGVIVITTKR